jgi:hypothetical protein
MNEQKGDLVRIYTGSEVSVIYLKAELENIGIAALVKNNWQSGITAGFGGGTPDSIDLFIQESDFENSKLKIEELVKNMDE